MNSKYVFKSILGLLFCLILTSCKELPPGEYDANEIGKIKKVIPGVVISKRAVNLHRNDADNAKNSSSSGFADSGYNQSHGVEYVIKLNSGGIISVVQSEDLKLKNKQKILVIYGRNTRVVADNGSDVY
jgi:outer membrane lipoprotein SlyB